MIYLRAMRNICPDNMTSGDAKYLSRQHDFGQCKVSVRMIYLQVIPYICPQKKKLLPRLLFSLCYC